jgi:hypothetical protein
MSPGSKVTKDDINSTPNDFFDARGNVDGVIVAQAVLPHIIRRAAKRFEHEAAPNHAFGVAHTGQARHFNFRLMHAQREECPNRGIDFAAFHLDDRWPEQACKIPSRKERAERACLHRDLQLPRLRRQQRRVGRVAVRALFCLAMNRLPTTLARHRVPNGPRAVRAKITRIGNRIPTIGTDDGLGRGFG